MTQELQQARDRFESERARYTSVAEEVAADIATVGRGRGLAVTTSGRAKTLDSFVKKAIVKGYADPWEQITDKAGARAIVADLAQQRTLVEALTDHWGARVLLVDDKAVELDVKTLAYSGVHLQLVVPRGDDDGEPDQCEVQVRTAAQDLWSVMSHQYLYKPLVEPPRTTQRALWRLVALMEIVDEEVQRAVNQILDDPEFPQARLLHDAEQVFYTLSTAQTDAELSLEVLRAVIDAVPTGERAGYADTLAAFVEDEHDRLRRFYARFAPGGDLQGEARYALGTQAESVILLERARSHRMLLADVLDGPAEGVRWLVAPLLAIWGDPLPETLPT